MTVWSTAETNPWIIPLASMQLHPGFFFRSFSFITLLLQLHSIVQNLPVEYSTEYDTQYYQVPIQKPLYCIFPKFYVFMNSTSCKKRTPNPTIRKITIFNIKAKASLSFPYQAKYPQCKCNDPNQVEYQICISWKAIFIYLWNVDVVSWHWRDKPKILHQVFIKFKLLKLFIYSNVEIKNNFLILNRNS